MPDNMMFRPPKPGDPDHAEDLFDEIQGVLRRRGAALIWHETGITLCLPATPAAGLQTEWRAIGQAKSITPIMIEWRPIAPTIAPGTVKQ